MDDFLIQITAAMRQVTDALRVDPSLWLILAPILILWVATELYYGEYKREHFGFSSALTGAMSLVWVSVVSLRLFLFADGGQSFVSLAALLLMAFALYGGAVVIVSFLHSISERILQKIASPSFLYFCSFVAIFAGEKAVDINIFTILALMIFFLAARAALFVVQKYFLGLRGDVERVREAGLQR